MVLTLRARRAANRAQTASRVQQYSLGFATSNGSNWKTSSVGLAVTGTTPVSAWPSRSPWAAQDMMCMQPCGLLPPRRSLGSISAYGVPSNYQAPS